MDRESLWARLKDAIKDQIRIPGTFLQPNLELYEVSTRPIDWLVIVQRLLPEGTTLDKIHEDQVISRMATLHDLLDYIELAESMAILEAKLNNSGGSG